MIWSAHSWKQIPIAAEANLRLSTHIVCGRKFYQQSKKSNPKASKKSNLQSLPPRFNKHSPYLLEYLIHPQFEKPGMLLPEI